MNLPLWSQVAGLAGFMVMSGPVVRAARYAHALHKLKLLESSSSADSNMINTAKSELKKLKDNWTANDSRALAIGLLFAIAGYIMAIVGELLKDGGCT